MALPHQRYQNAEGAFGELSSPRYSVWAPLWFELCRGNANLPDTSDMDVEARVRASQRYAEFFGLTMEEFFGQGCPFTFFGHFGHALTASIGAHVLSCAEGDLERMRTYLNLLLVLRELGMLDVRSMDAFGSSMIDIAEAYDRALSSDSSTRRRSAARALLCVVVLGTKIPRAIQRAFRNAVERRRARMRAYSRCLEDIVYAPPGVVGTRVFSTFRGGTGYAALASKYASSSSFFNVH